MDQPNIKENDIFEMDVYFIKLFLSFSRPFNVSILSVWFETVIIHVRVARLDITRFIYRYTEYITFIRK